MLRGGTFRIWRPGERSSQHQNSDYGRTDGKNKNHMDNTEDHQKNKNERGQDKKQDKGRKQRRMKPYARWFGGGGSFSFSFHRKKSPLETRDNKSESPLIAKENCAEIESTDMTKTNSGKRSKRDENDLKGSVDSGLCSHSSYLELNTPNERKKWSFKPRILRAMSFKNESESDFDNRRIVVSPTSDFDVTSQKRLSTPPLRNERSRAIRPTDSHNQRKTPYGRKGQSLGRQGTFDENIGSSHSSNMYGIIKTESSTLNRKSKKLAFHEPVRPYQSGSVQRSQSESNPLSQFGTVGRSQSGIIPYSQFRTVERSWVEKISCSGMLERSPSGILKLSQSREAVHRSQSRISQSEIEEHGTRSWTPKSRSIVQSSQSIAFERSQYRQVNRPQSVQKNLSHSRPVVPLERSQSMAIQRSQTMRINRFNSEEFEGPKFRKEEKRSPPQKSAQFGSHQSLIKEPVMIGNVSSQWEMLCKAASLEVILNIPTVDSFAINVIFNSNIVDSLNPVEISNVISSTRNILFANWFISGPNFEESIVRRSPNFNVILHQVQTFLIIASGISISKFINLFKDLQNRCVSRGFYPPWVCLEETKSLYIDYWCDLAAMGA